jgi:hypothetical protein
MKVREAGAWLAAFASLSGALLAANNLSDLTNKTTARQNLDLEIGVDVQAYDAQLADVAGLSPADNNFIVGNGTNFVAESGSTARTSLGLGSIATQDSSSVTVTGGSINNTPIGGTTAAAGKFTTLEATGVTTVQAGSVSAPAITTTGDTNTGIFFPAADTIAFAEGGAESMRITADGSVLIGGTTDTGQTSGFLTIQRTDGAPGLDMFRNDTSIADTDVLTQIRFLGNDTTSNTAAQLAYIRATASGTHSAGDNPTDLVFATTPDGTSSVAEAGRITESGAYILKGGTLNPGGIGITFPASQSASSNANTLDDYEEGTFSPSVTSTAGSITTSSVLSAKYTKIGNAVNICVDVSIANIGTASGGLLISMPFTTASASAAYGREYNSAGYGMDGRVAASDTSLQLYNTKTDNGNAFAGGSGIAFVINLTYFIS